MRLEKDFAILFDELSTSVYNDNANKGFWDTKSCNSKDRNRPEMIALMHSELSEALEAIRHGNPPDDHCPEFSSVEVELADTIIRILDYSGGFGLRVGEALEAKLKYNRSRPHKHGKEF